MNQVQKKYVEDSRTEQFRLLKYEDINGANRLFGGKLMAWIDEVAGLVAKRHARMNVTTASVDNLKFLRGAYQKDVIVIIGRTTFVGTTSMEVKVDSYVEGLEGERILINRAYFTMVALDENDRPAKVPELILETQEEKEEWENGKKRRENRVMRKAEGF